MGAYLATGLITEFSVPVSDIGTLHKDAKTALRLFEESFINNASSFDRRIEGKFYLWELKESVVNGNLVEFIKRYYRDFYDDANYHKTTCETIINNISKFTSPSQFWEYAANARESCYHCEHESVSVLMNDCEVGVNYSFLRLSFEGKVSFESIEEHLEFFEQAVRKMYSDSPLGGSLVVTILG